MRPAAYWRPEAKKYTLAHFYPGSHGGLIVVRKQSSACGAAEGTEAWTPEGSVDCLSDSLTNVEAVINIIILK